MTAGGKGEGIVTFRWGKQETYLLETASKVWKLKKSYDDILSSISAVSKMRVWSF